MDNKTKSYFKSGKKLSLFFTVLFILLFSMVNVVYSQFRFENPIWIKNNTAVALTNVQVMLKLNTQIPISLGRMDPTGKDIRFTSACDNFAFLSHWLEAYLNTDSTKIWVNVPSIGANDSTLIFLYYGNPTAVNISTLNIFDGPHSSTDSVVVSGWNSLENSQRGFRFTANQDLLVGFFGKRVPLASQRYLTLFDFNSQAILAQIQVSAGTNGIYNYNPLPNPIWLKSGKQYIMTIFNNSGYPGDSYYYGESSQIGQHLTYGDSRVAFNCSQNTFPTTFYPNRHNGTPDFLYYIKQEISPVPTYRMVRGGDTTTPAAPTNLTAFCYSGQSVLKWNKSLEYDIALYQIFCDTINNPSTAAMIGTVNDPDTTFTATGLINGKAYYFWVKAVDCYCSPKISAFSIVASCIPMNVNPIGNGVPDKYYLDQNYPNPFNPTTDIRFKIKDSRLVTLKIFNLLGKEIATLVNEKLNPGIYEVTFDGSNLSSGTYFYKLTAGEFTDTKKLTLIK